MASDITALTYTQRDLPKNAFFLDKILDRLPPIFQIDGSPPPSDSIGNLSELPPEILYLILNNLHIRDLMRFRQCSRPASFFVNTMPGFSQALTSAPNTIKAIVATRTTRDITLPVLLEKLAQRQCDACGLPASFIYVGTCARYCLKCSSPFLNEDFSYPITKDYIGVHYRLAQHVIQEIPTFRFLPATFKGGLFKIVIPSGRLMYDGNIAAEQSLEFENPDPDALHSKIDSVGFYRPCGRPAFMESDQDATVPSVIVQRDEPLLMFRKHMSIVYAPWLDIKKGSAEEGVYCSACLYTKHPDLLYTVRGFHEHLQDCRIGFVDDESRGDRDRGLAGPFELDVD